MIVGLARMWYGFLGLISPGHGEFHAAGTFTDLPDWVSPAASLSAVQAVGVESQSWVSLVWNFLLDCLIEGKNILFALLIVVPCEIKGRRLNKRGVT